jgi:hypothetical protein
MNAISFETNAYSKTILLIEEMINADAGKVFSPAFVADTIADKNFHHRESGKWGTLRSTLRETSCSPVLSG